VRNENQLPSFSLNQRKFLCFRKGKCKKEYRAQSPVVHIASTILWLPLYYSTFLKKHNEKTAESVKPAYAILFIILNL
jgi:hypothetical protein